MPKQIKNQPSLGKKVEEIKIEFCLTTFKPLHAKSLVEYYNEIRSENGSPVIINGWKAAGIYDAIKAGSSGLQSINPLEDFFFIFLFFILRQYKFLIYKFRNSTMNINSYTN